MAAADVLSMILTASLTLAGILLVFVGFIYSQAQSFPSETDESVTRKFKQVARVGMVPFGLAILIAGLAFQKILAPHTSVGGLIPALFWLEMGLLLLYGIVSVLLYLE